MAVVAVVVVAIKNQYTSSIVLGIRAILIVYIYSIISGCATTKGDNVQIQYSKQSAYQQRLEQYISKNPLSLVKKIGAPDIIDKNQEYTILEWRFIERADKDFWWIGNLKCVTRVFVNPKNGLIEDVFSYGNRCIPF